MDLKQRCRQRDFSTFPQSVLAVTVRGYHGGTVGSAATCNAGIPLLKCPCTCLPSRLAVTPAGSQWLPQVLGWETWMLIPAIAAIWGKESFQGGSLVPLCCFVYWINIFLKIFIYFKGRITESQRVLSQAYEQEGRNKIRAAGLELALKWDTTTTDGSLACYITALPIMFLSHCKLPSLCFEMILGEGEEEKPNFWLLTFHFHRITHRYVVGQQWTSTKTVTTI